MYADFNYLVKDNITYTVDMLRLKTQLTYEQFDKIRFHMYTAFNKFIENDYQSTSISEFKYNINIKIKEGESYWFRFYA